MDDNINKPKEELKLKLSALSHDIRSPLAVCQSFLNVLEMSEYKLSPPELEMLVLDVRDSIEKSLSLIDEQMTQLRASLNI